MATQSALTRTVEGRELPPPGRWKIDPAHSEVQLVVRHMMVAKVRGRFREFSGTINVTEVPEESTVEATINTASRPGPAGSPPCGGRVPNRVAVSQPSQNPGLRHEVSQRGGDGSTDHRCRYDVSASRHYAALHESPG